MKADEIVDLLDFGLRVVIFIVAAEYIAERTSRKMWNMYH